jgi:hypothetical protein
MQRLFASFIPIYVGGRTVFLSRYSSDYMNINEALESIGFRHKAKIEMNTNIHLYESKVHMIVFDSNWHHKDTELDYDPDYVDRDKIGSVLYDEERLLWFHSVFPNNYFGPALPGADLTFTRDRNAR